MVGGHRHDAPILGELEAGFQEDASYPAIAAAANQAQPTDTNSRKEKTLRHTPIALIGSKEVEATRHYSVFDVSQKRAIILSGSFFGLLSYMTSSIFYPALDQVHISVVSLAPFPNMV